MAPVDFTGYWVSVVTEDWRWRMVTPPRGDYTSVPLTAEGRRVADSWDPAADEAAGEECRAYGAAAIMRTPGRLHITWRDPNTLQIETDSGMQTRLFRFDKTVAPAEAPTWQGHSVAEWYSSSGALSRGPVAAGQTLKVVTTRLRPGYLRKNGVPYSGDAVVTEYFDRIEEINGDTWLLVTTVVEDPLYLNEPFMVSSHFKLEPDGSRWMPTPCSAR
ncbi:MAG: hypothetical protein HY657_04070 [Acidobacteria bacterium]|nr:hypothetical protein [Acidobacteriota bacterium]